MKNKQTTRRKLQFAGNSSYVLTLPKKWIISQNLDTNNSEVLIEELSDSTIRITPPQFSYYFFSCNRNFNWYNFS